MPARWQQLARPEVATEQNRAGWRPCNEHLEWGEVLGDYSVDSEIEQARFREVELRRRVLNGLSRGGCASRDSS